MVAQHVYSDALMLLRCPFLAPLDPHAVPEGVLASPSGGWSPQGSCVTLGKLLNLSVPCFLHLQHEDNELPPS